MKIFRIKKLNADENKFDVFERSGYTAVLHHEKYVNTLFPSEKDDKIWHAHQFFVKKSEKLIFLQETQDFVEVANLI